METTNAVQTALALLYRERDAISRALDVLQPVLVKRKYVRRVPPEPIQFTQLKRRRTKARGWTQAQRIAQARKMQAYWRNRRAKAVRG